jgi:transcription elongation factor GreA
MQSTRGKPRGINLNKLEKMLMMKVPMTPQGAAKMRAELEKLKHEDRPRIIQAIAEARAMGDLSENAEYHSAKNQQSLIEGRIHDLEAKLSHAQIIDVAKIPNKDRIVFGATVTIINQNTNAENIYQIVGDYEADLKKNKISINSPLARALVGKHVNNTIEVTTPNGIDEYMITKVEFI